MPTNDLLQASERDETEGTENSLDLAALVKKVQGEYEEGKTFNDTLNLYENVKKCEDFYLDRQWEGLKVSALRPIQINVLRRTISMFQSQIVSDDISFSMRPFMSTEEQDSTSKVLEECTRNVIERNHEKTQNREVLRDAAVDESGYLYYWFDPDIETGQMAKGDIVSEVLMTTNVIFGNPYCGEVQKQPSILIIRRRPAKVVQEEARENGAQDVESIRPDNGSEFVGEDRNGGASSLVTEITRLWKRKQTEVDPLTGEESVKKTVWSCTVAGNCMVKEPVDTGLTLYPLAKYTWEPVKNCYHGVSPVLGMIPAQIAVNKMVTSVVQFHQNMAFPKIIYDTQKFPNGWNGDPGKAIGVRGTTGNVSDSLFNVYSGMNMPATVSQTIDSLIGMMKDAMGASDASLGNIKPDNTSAIIAAQKATAMPLELKKRAFEQFNEDGVRIKVDMMCAYYGQRTVMIEVSQVDPLTGESISRRVPQMVDFDALSLGEIDLNVQVGAAAYWSELVQTNNVDALRQAGMIPDALTYLNSIPDGNLPNKQEFIDSYKRYQEQQKVLQMTGAGQGAPQSGGNPMQGVNMKLPV